MPEYRRDPELYAQPTTWPGAKLPHTWVTENGRRVSTLDLGGHGEFSRSSPASAAGPWLDAAAALAESTGVRITPVSIGPGERYEDPYGTWADLREIDDGGALLVRPDLYIARAASAAARSRPSRRTSGSPARCEPCYGPADRPDPRAPDRRRRLGRWPTSF